MSLTGAAGTPAAASRSSQVPTSSWANRSPSSATISRALRDPVRVGGEPRIGRQVERAEERGEQPVVGRGHHQLSVPGGECLVGHDQREGRAVAAGRLACGQVGHQVVGHEAHPGLEEREIELPPFALVECGDDRERRPDARSLVDQRDAHPNGSALGLAGDAHDPGLALEERVVTSAVGERADAPVAADRAVDEPRVPLAQGRVAKPTALGGARAQALDDHVGAAGELEQSGEAVRVGEVEGERALAGVRRQEEHSVLAPGGWAPAPGLVAPVGTLDLDDVGAEHAQDLGAVRPRERAAQIEDADPGERLERHGRIISKPSG